MESFKKMAEWFLGVPPAEPGQGTTWRYGHSFPWPSWVLLLFGIAAVAYVYWIYRRDAGHLGRSARLGLAALRLATIGVLLFILSQAVLAIERTGLPYVVVMLDVSGSMGTEDGFAQSETKSSAETL